MISDEILDLAVGKGVITLAQAEALRHLAKDRLPPPPPWPPAIADTSNGLQRDTEDNEAVRFITSFADIFVSLGLALFFSSSAYLLSLYAGGTAMWAGVAGLAWLVAEFFTRRRHLALPSILLLVLFSASVFMTSWKLVAQLDPMAPLNWWHPTDQQSWLLAHATSLALSGLATAAFAGLHYLRFRVPVTIAAMAAALIGTLVGLIYWMVPDISGRGVDALLFVCGLFVFLLAMRFDMSDLRRLTRRTDIAFWLHLLAAPLIVHPLVVAVGGQGAVLDNFSAVLVLAVFLGLGLVSLVIDRRALLVSGLTYAGLAFGALLERSGVADKTPATTLLALGVFILLLSALWQPLRRAILKLLPTALVIRLPHSHLPAS